MTGPIIQSQSTNQPIIQSVNLFSIIQSFLEFCFKLFKKSQVILEVETQVIHVEFQLGDAFDAHSEGEAGVYIGVDVGGFQHVGIDHAATQYLEKSRVFTDLTTLAAAEGAGDVHLS